MKPNIEIKGISLVRIYKKKKKKKKWKAYAVRVKLPLHFSRNFDAIRRSTTPVRRFTKALYTSLQLNYLRGFNKMLDVDDKGFALPI